MGHDKERKYLNTNNEDTGSPWSSSTAKLESQDN